jgi:hypothetical protein
MKAIIITGCRDCPYRRIPAFKFTWVCSKFDFEISSDILIDIPETPHPDCKLPDLPTQDEIRLEAIAYSNTHDDLKAVDFGANYILNAIK